MDRQLADFATRAEGLELQDRLKLILFAAGQKPATYVALKITGKNLGEKRHLERHLAHYLVSRPKGFEEITRVRKNKVFWAFQGIWYGYDLFANKHLLKQFQRYTRMVAQQKHAAADKLAGKLYGYPSCCVRQYVREHDRKYVRKTYTAHSFFKKIQDASQAFPYVLHEPCSLSCTRTAQLNRQYESAVRKIAPTFYRAVETGQVHRASFVVDGETDVRLRPGGKPVWAEKERDGHEYTLVSTTPFKGHQYLYKYVTRARLPNGTVFDARAIRKHFSAVVELANYKGILPRVVHYRRFLTQ